MLKRIIIDNYRLIKHADFEVNPDMNIFVGDNDSGKSTLLEAIAILTSGRLNGFAFDRQLKANMFNSEVRNGFKEWLDHRNGELNLPRIMLEAYWIDDASNAQFKGTNNSLTQDCAGIRVDIEFNPEHEPTLKKMLDDKEVYDIPIEFYSVKYHYFSGDPVSFRYCPAKAIIIDTTRKDYSNVVSRFITESIADYLDTQDRIDLSTAFRKSRNDFHSNPLVEKLNENIRNNVNIGNRSLSVDLREDDVDEWKRQMSVIVDNTPFENVGFGSQNTIKIELAIKNSEEQANIILMEEPENNLSYTNMEKLIQRIQESTGKQIFISTHNSYVANKLDLGKLLLVKAGAVFSFGDLDAETITYFKKLPGYDTLRLVLAENVILVEGPTEELLLQRAYLDKYGKLPIMDGVDVITVNSLAFKRYCDIALLMKKTISVLTDNDGCIASNITEKYKGYIEKGELLFHYESDEQLSTVEKSVIDANLVNGEPSATFKEVISKNDSMKNKNKDEVLAFMLNNKTEWAIRVFDSEQKIRFPGCITNVINQFDKNECSRGGQDMGHCQ